jgi:GT2 family glycosyltransferase
VIGLGVITYRRPSFFNQTIAAVQEHLRGVADHICVRNDSAWESAQNFGYDYASLDDIEVSHPSHNMGVAAAKNWCLKNLLDRGCDWFFLLEDDIEVVSRGAIDEYIAVSKATGNQHLMFAHHGPANEEGPRSSHPDENYEIFAHCVGAWTLYTREIIETVGFLDEHFPNTYDHVEYTFRIAKAGFTIPMWHFMDVFDSTRLLREIPGSMEQSTIRRNPGWISSINAGLAYWRAKDPDCPL